MLHTIFQIRLLLGLVPLLGGVLWLGMDGGSTYYDKSPAEVKAAISEAYVPVHILGQYVEGSRVTTPDDKTVVTALLDRDGTELMRFVTTVTPDGTGSQVDTVVTKPEGRHAKGAEEAMKTQAFTMSLMEKLADEHVAAAIEGRPFDMLAFNPAASGMMKAAGYEDTFNEINASAAEFSRIQQDNPEDETAAQFADDSWVESSGQPMSEFESGGGWAEE